MCHAQNSLLGRHRDASIGSFTQLVVVVVMSVLVPPEIGVASFSVVTTAVQLKCTNGVALFLVKDQFWATSVAVLM